MKRSMKWIVTSVITVAAFGGGLWLGDFLSDRLLPPGWPDAGRAGAATAFAALVSATIAFSIGKWWTEHEPEKKPENPTLHQSISGNIFGGSGVTANNVGRDLNIGDLGSSHRDKHHG
ncbi:hypothetical protein AB0F81_03510 [Actinoplanes sp. NPDC024001]|uniref:hypothetical protein n=1 Tax=Actinoplanes sp. NPDC024001 TaxID=3154598 RepID=UPI0033CC9782